MNELYRNAAESPVTKGFVFDYSVIEKALKQLHQSGTPTKIPINADLFSELRRVMRNAVEDGVQQVPAESGWVKEMKNNANVFAAFKSHRMGKDMAYAG